MVFELPLEQNKANWASKEHQQELWVVLQRLCSVWSVFSLYLALDQKLKRAQDKYKSDEAIGLSDFISYSLQSGQTLPWN